VRLQSPNFPCKVISTPYCLSWLLALAEAGSSHAKPRPAPITSGPDLFDPAAPFPQRQFCVVVGVSLIGNAGARPWLYNHGCWGRTVHQSLRVHRSLAVLNSAHIRSLSHFFSCLGLFCHRAPLLPRMVYWISPVCHLSWLSHRDDMLTD
jgi:hypothetical protein